MDRIYNLRKLMSENNLDGVLAYSAENRRYLSGFTGSAGFLIVGKESIDFVTDFRYMEQAESQCEGWNIIIHGGTPIENLKEVIKKAGINRLGIEEDFMTVSFSEEIKKALPGIVLVPARNVFSKLRIKKDYTEIANIRKAAAIADEAFSHILGYIRPGLSEAEVALELEYFMKKKGASGLAFDTIAASGIRSSLPHGIASEKLIRNEEFLTLDFGCVYNGYCSDMTRTVFIGKASERHKKVYDIVLRANIEALKGLKPGITGKAADKIARDIITDAGYGEYFGHGLGHGVGLAIHEDPKLSKMGEYVLEEGMVVTDEPGIYIPGFGGVRIEDLVLVTKTGAEALSKSVKDFIEL